VVEGARAGVADGALALGPLRIALDGLEVVDLRLARRLRAPVAAAARALARHGGPPPAAGPFEPALAGALARFGATGDVAGLAGIVGVGEGLTPAGDDVIVGVLAGLDAAREASRAAAGRRQRLLAALEKGAVATTRLSAQMLDAAGAGLYAEPVLGVLHALVRQPPSAPELRRAVAALLATGHRSGADTLRGIRAALEGPARARRTPRRTA
jgi:hypothetical protein